MTMTTLKMQNEVNLNAGGIKRNKNSKPVMSLTTGKIWSSATDTAKELKVDIGTVSACCRGLCKTCAGHRLIYLKNINDHLGEISDRMHTMSVKERKVDRVDRINTLRLTKERLATKMRKEAERISRIDAELQALENENE